LPHRVCKVLRALIDGTPVSHLHMPSSTFSYARGDLEALGLVQDDGLSDWAVDRLTNAGIAVAPQPKRTGFGKA
jgi:hypothetical protein